MFSMVLQVIVEKLREAIDWDTPPRQDLVWRKKDGGWVAIFVGLDGRPIAVQVDYDPWTGESLS
jgi:hypothetical protein